MARRGGERAGLGDRSKTGLAEGGTSAGLAILGEHVYDACTGSVQSDEAPANPYDRRISISAGLFDLAPLRGVLTDSHAGARDRLGRLAVFLARLMTDDRSVRPAGLAVDEATSVVVDRAGSARVMGRGTAWLMLPTAPPDTCVAGQLLTFRHLRLWRLKAGDTLTLPGSPAHGEYLRSIVAGRFGADPY